MGEDRPDLNLSQDRQFQAIVRCSACNFEIIAGPPLDGAEVQISARLFAYALPALQIVHGHQDGCGYPKLDVVVNELQSSGPLTPVGRRHLRIVA
jgi:hypothetical protein